MRSFVGTLLLASAYAQSSVSSDIQAAVSSVTNWLLGKTKENLSTDSQKKEFTLYDVGNTTMGLKACFSLDNTALGVNFVTAEFDLSGPAANWATGTAQLVYFQVEEPVVSNTTARLLQATNSTAVNATGTGNFEGWSGSLFQPVNSTAIVLKTNKNSWGKKNFKTDTSVYTSFGGADAVNTASSSAW